MDEPVQPQISITQSSTIVFDREHAVIYDWQYGKLVPLRDVLPPLRRFVLSNLPDNAHILAKNKFILQINRVNWKHAINNLNPQLRKN
jgi:hypothetical protein